VEKTQIKKGTALAVEEFCAFANFGIQNTNKNGQPKGYFYAFGNFSIHSTNKNGQPIP